MRGLRSVSFQLPCEEDVLQSAFEDKPLCVPRQLAELLQLSVEEVCADFDAMLRHDWRRLGISAEEVREFCVWRNAPTRVLSSQGDLVDSYDPALKEHRAVCFLAFDGHCYMYRAVKRVLERQASLPSLSLARFCTHRSSNASICAIIHPQLMREYIFSCWRLALEWLALKFLLQCIPQRIRTCKLLCSLSKFEGAMAQARVTGDVGNAIKSNRNFKTF